MLYFADIIADIAKNAGVEMKDAVVVGKSVLDFPGKPVTADYTRVKNKLLKALGFKRSLLPHQQRLLAAEIELANNQCTPLPDITKSKIKIPEGAEEPMLVSNSTFLQLKMGGGKTILTIAFILLQRILSNPAPVPCPGICLDNHAEANNIHNDLTPQIALVPTEVIPINVVYVAPVVLGQWLVEFRTFAPNLRVGVISNSEDLMEFGKAYYVDRAYPDIDVLVVVQSEVYKGLLFPKAEEDFDRDDKMPVIHFVSEIFYRIHVNVVFYDDPEIQTMPKSTHLINALHHVYLSGTRNTGISIQPKPYVDYDTVPQTFDGERSFVCGGSYDPLMQYGRVIVCDADFLEQSVRLPMVNLFKVVVASTQDRLINAIASLAGTDIQEMMNAGAIGEVVSKLKIAATTVDDVFRHMLKEHYDNFIRCRRIKYFFGFFKDWFSYLDYGEGDAFLKMLWGPQAQEVFYDTYENFLRDDFDPETGETVTSANYDLIFDTISTTLRGCAAPTTKSRMNEIEVNMRDAQIAEEEKKFESVVSKLTSNDSISDCPFCRQPFDNAAMRIILKCCTCMGCECTLSRISAKTIHSRGGMTSSECPNPACKKLISAEHIIAFGNSNISITEMFENVGNESEVLTDIQNAEDEEAEPDPFADEEPKNKILMRLLNKMAVTATTINMNYPYIMQGMRDAPYTGKAHVKPIISAGYEETVSGLEKLFAKHKIKYTVIRRGMPNVHDLICEWNEYEGVWALILLSYEVCAGLNLQIGATHVIFTHRIGNVDVAAQLIARGQRPGRPGENLQVYEILYENEKNTV